MVDEWNADRAQKSLLPQHVPPPHFSFATASKTDRLRYGYPAEPDRNTQPNLWAKWERNLHHPWRRVVPRYDLKPARHIPTARPVGSGTSSNWSGAVATPPANSSFANVSAVWSVPGASPPPTAWNGKSYNDGLYNALHWVGIGGDIGNGAANLLQAGTGTDVNVVDGVISTTTYFWFEWWNSALDNGYARLDGFTVNPGDQIEVTVCTTNDATGSAIIGNTTTHDYTSQAINPPSAGLSLVGNTAEWILEREGFTGGSLATLADYGTISFSQCAAGGSGFESNLSGSGSLNMQDGSAIVSTAVDLSDTVLECHYGAD